MALSYLYAVISARDVAAVSSALSDAVPLGNSSSFNILEFGGLAVIASGIADPEVLQTRRNMLAHTRVLEAALQSAALLPMRFGVVSDDAGRLAAHIDAHRDRLLEALSEFRDCVEFGLAVDWPREAALSALVAAEPALRQRHAQLAALGAEAYYERIDFGRRIAEALDLRRKTAERSLVAALRPRLKDLRVLTPEEDVQTLRAALLLGRNDEEGLLRDLPDLVSAFGFAPRAEPVIRFVGPAPIYNFVSLSLDMSLFQDMAEAG